MPRADDQCCDNRCSDEEAIRRAKNPEVVGRDGLISRNRVRQLSLGHKDVKTTMI